VGRFTPGILCALLTAVASISGSPLPICPPCLQPPREPVSLLHANSIRGRGTRGEYRIMTPEGSRKKRRTRKGTREPKETQDGKEGQGRRDSSLLGSRGFPFCDAIAAAGNYKYTIRFADRAPDIKNVLRSARKFSVRHFADASLAYAFLLLYLSGVTMRP